MHRNSVLAMHLRLSLEITTLEPMCHDLPASEAGMHFQQRTMGCCPAALSTFRGSISFKTSFTKVLGYCCLTNCSARSRYVVLSLAEHAQQYSLLKWELDDKWRHDGGEASCTVLEEFAACASDTQ
jgi:hypothetical protein